MAFITTNYSEVQDNDFSALPTGNYEIVIKSAQERAAKTGSESIQLDLVVRNDLDAVPALKDTNGKYHNRHVFMDNWKRRETKQYDLQNIQTILQVVGVPEGTNLNSIEDFISAIAGKPAKVYIKRTTDSYQGESREINRVAPWNFSKTDYPQVQHVWKDQQNGKNPFADSQTEVDIKNSDLPF